MRMLDLALDTAKVSIRQAKERAFGEGKLARRHILRSVKFAADSVRLHDAGDHKVLKEPECVRSKTGNSVPVHTGNYRLSPPIRLSPKVSPVASPSRLVMTRSDSAGTPSSPGMSPVISLRRIVPLVL